MILASTMVWHGRYWYDTLTLGFVAAFFLVEMVLLFRNSLLGWAMTAKCIMLAAVFLYALLIPPVYLPEEDVSVGAALLRTGLMFVLGSVIAILLWMRRRRRTVIVGLISPEGDAQGRW